MSPHAWKCVACSKSYRAKGESSRAPKCPSCGVALVPSARKVAPPQPKTRVGSRAPVPFAPQTSSRPVGPQEALAMVSSSSWLPDPEPPPSPDTSSLHRPRVGNRISDGAPGASRPEKVKRYWVVGGTLGGVILVLVLTIITMLNRPAASHAQSARREEGREGATDAGAVVIPAAAVEAPSQVAEATPRVVNLLKLIDPRKDTFTGNWRVQNGGAGPLLSSDGTQHARLNIPYAPPEEYDFRVDFVRQGGDNCMAQMFTHRNPCALILYGWKGKFSGFQLVKDHFADKNETGVRDLPTANGQHHSSIVRVRKQYIEAWLDGSLIIHYDTDGRDLGSKDWAIDTPLGVGSQTSPTLFQVVELTEVTGRGHPLR